MIDNDCVDVGGKQLTTELTTVLYKDSKHKDSVYCGLFRNESSLLLPLVPQ